VKGESRIRDLRPDDSVSEITALLHAAYADLAAQGLRYVASHQDDEVTRRRLERGSPVVVERDGRLIATVTLYPSRADHFVPWYRRPEVRYFGQFGVLPPERGRGIGLRLVEEMECRARTLGAAELALDTAEGAARLIAWYARLGYRFIEHVSWPVTNYRSVVLSKPLVPVAAPSRSTV
jgi:GNAT superfamily N-acetyltransferase